MKSRADAASRLNDLEAVLRQPDAIMEPTIVEPLRAYVADLGQPQQAVEYLTDGYQGYAQMATLMCQWLATASPAKETNDPGDGGGQPAVTETSCLRVRALELAEVVGGKTFASGAQQRDADGMNVPLSVQDLVKERFDPGKFTTLFSRGGSGAPSWLQGILENPAGRQLIYDLSARFSNSLLLNFAIQKILQQPGMEAEVAAVGPSLGSYFGVFHRLMVSRLSAALALEREEDLCALSLEIQKIAIKDEQTYLYLQALLQELGRTEGRPAAGPDRGARLRRLASELEATAVAAQGPMVWRLGRLFPPACLVTARVPGGTRAAGSTVDVAIDLMSAPPAAQPSTASFLALYEAVFGEREARGSGVNYSTVLGSGDAAPSREHAVPDVHPALLSLLRHPRMFHVLFQRLFGPASPPSVDLKHALTGLLALAAGGTDPARFASTADALVAAEALNRAVLEGGPMRPGWGDGVAALLDVPVCAGGLLRGMALRLTNAAYWTTTIHTLRTPPFLFVLQGLIPRQPALHPQVLALLGGALEALGNGNDHIARGLLDCMVLLLSSGHAIPVLAWADVWAASQPDASLLRHFVLGVLGVAAPPYSPLFAAALLRLMMHARLNIASKGRTGESIAHRALLAEFAAACGALNFRPPLLAREKLFLQELCALRPPQAD